MYIHIYIHTHFTLVCSWSCVEAGLPSHPVPQRCPMKPADVDLFIRRLFALRAPKVTWQAVISCALGIVMVDIPKHSICLWVQG